MADSVTATDSATRLYHNPNCSKSRGALELLTRLAAEQNLTLEVIEYIQSPPDRATLQQLLSQLPNSPAELVRHDKNFQALNLNEADFQSADQVIELLLVHPQLMQRPVAVFRNKAAIGRPPEDLQGLYT